MLGYDPCEINGGTKLAKVLGLLCSSERWERQPWDLSKRSTGNGLEANDMFASQKRRKNASSVLIEIGFPSSGSNGVSGEQTLKRG